MAPGDVEVRIVTATIAAIDTAVTAMRSTANDKWLMAHNGEGQVIIVNVEET